MAMLFGLSVRSLVFHLGRSTVASTASRRISFQQRGLDENSTVKRARLLYQCRKRGTLENGILLSSFASEHLKDMNDSELVEFDHLLNRTENEWQLYYWITGRETAPPEFDCSVLHQLQKHCQKITYTTNQQPPITPSHIYTS